MLQCSVNVYYKSKMPHGGRPIIPKGVQDLMLGLCIAIVKYRPEDIPAFAMSFFDALIIFKQENPSMPINELLKEFSSTKGSHFYRRNNKDVKQQQDTVQSPEPFPHPKPIRDRARGPLLMEARCQDFREPFPLENQTMDKVEVSSNYRDHTEHDLQVSATTITLSPGPILTDIARDLAVYRCKIYPNESRVSSPLSSTESLVRVQSALFERVSVSEIRENEDAVLIRTGVLPSESLIIVKTERVPEMIVFQADPLLAAASPPSCAVNHTCSCDSLEGSQADVGSALEAVHHIFSILFETKAPTVETQHVMVPEPEKHHAQKDHATPVKTSSSSIPVTPVELPGSSPTLSQSSVQIHGSSPTLSQSSVQIHGSSPTLSQSSVQIHGSSPALSQSSVQIHGSSPTLSQSSVEISSSASAVSRTLDVPEVHNMMAKHSVHEATTDPSDVPCPIPAATLDTECVAVIKPPPDAQSVEIRSSPPTAVTVATDSSNLTCPSAVTVETKLDHAMPLGSAAATPVSLSHPVVPLQETRVSSVSFPLPVTPLTEETHSHSSACPPIRTASGESRTPFLVYLPLPGPEVVSTPDLLSHLGLGLEEAKSLPLLYHPMAQADIPMTSVVVATGQAPTVTAAPNAAMAIATSYVTSLPVVTDIARTPSSVANNTGLQEVQRTSSYLSRIPGDQEPQRTPSYLADNSGVQEMPRNPSNSDMVFTYFPGNAGNQSRNNSVVNPPSAVASHSAMSRTFSLYPQGGSDVAHGNHSPGHCPASLQDQAGMALQSHGSQTNAMPLCSHGHNVCSSTSGSGSQWRLCHLTRPESQIRMAGTVCPHQNSLNIMDCHGLGHIANIPMYQDCVHCSSSGHLACSRSSHGNLYTQHMSGSRCPAHNLGTTFLQPRTCSTDQLVHIPQQCRLTANPSREMHPAQGLCPLHGPLPQQSHSCAELCRLGSSCWAASTNRRQSQGRLENTDCNVLCATHHNRGSATNTHENHFMNCSPHGN
ncbi:hypothetical protein DPEC_G00065230 [Dallia pectoralis]|uniref:Uncharacterized protein n=1 Tax=Dallia pectoralis TaxID=75939 RepID=A0ACC2H865_DALPE|nr:hypothetical protein DPEC_G00065230 [Dallia pectoralis]